MDRTKTVPTMTVMVYTAIQAPKLAEIQLKIINTRTTLTLYKTINLLRMLIAMATTALLTTL